MNPVQVISGLLSGLTSYLEAKRAQKTIDSVQSQADAIGTWLARTITAIVGVWHQQQGAVDTSQQYAKQIGHDLIQVEGATEARFRLVRDQWLPHSLAFLSGRLYQQAIVPLRRQVQGLIAQLAAIIGRLVALERWRQSWVDPAIANYYGVRNTNLPAWRQLRQWLAAPGEFGQWAAPPITGPLIGYLAADQHKASRDNLSLILSAAWTEVPDRTWQHLLALLVRDL